MQKFKSRYNNKIMRSTAENLKLRLCTELLPTAITGSKCSTVLYIYKPWSVKLLHSKTIQGRATTKLGINTLIAADCCNPPSDS